jgi:pimeloyl-ACP methyl ester carboxylesterase
MSSPLHVVRAGTDGPPLVLVHGSATDSSTWTIQLAGPLPRRYRVIAYDRRGAGRSPNRPGVAWHTIEEHAAELVALIADLDEPAILAGSSCGAVVVLEACRRAPGRIRGAIAIEPPLAPSDDTSLAPLGFVADLDRLAAADGPGAAAQRFLVTVLGEAAWARLPRMYQERAAASGRRSAATATPSTPTASATRPWARSRPRSASWAGIGRRRTSGRRSRPWPGPCRPPP